MATTHMRIAKPASSLRAFLAAAPSTVTKAVPVQLHPKSAGVRSAPPRRIHTHQCPESPVSKQCKTGPDNQPSKSAMKVAQLQNTGPQLPKHPKPNQFIRQVEETRGPSKPDATQQQRNWSRPGQNPSWPRCPPPTCSCRGWQDRRLDPKCTPTLRNPSRRLIRTIHGRIVFTLFFSREISSES